MSQTDFEPRFKERVLVKFSSKDWVDFEEPQILFFQGMRGSGKTALIMKKIEQFKSEGFLVMHIWASKSMENLYWTINKNCKTNYSKLRIIVNAFYDNTHQGNHRARCASKGLFGDEYKQFFQTAIDTDLIEKSINDKFRITEKGIKLHKNELLHCNCSKQHCIMLAVPDYVDFDEDKLHRFNGNYFRDMKHYLEYFSDITTENKKLLEDGKLLMPEQFRPKALIKVRQFTTPTSTERKKKFRDEFTQIILDARQQSRVLVMNPTL